MLVVSSVLGQGGWLSGGQVGAGRSAGGSVRDNAPAVRCAGGRAMARRVYLRRVRMACGLAQASRSCWHRGRDTAFSSAATVWPAEPVRKNLSAWHQHLHFVWYLPQCNCAIGYIVASETMRACSKIKN